MSTELEPRPIQTKIKHEILERYISEWGYILTMGLSGLYHKLGTDPLKLTTRFVYVDCFSYRGKYAQESSMPVYGSPIIGIKGLERITANFATRNGAIPDTYVVLVEKDAKSYKILLETLEEYGYGKRLRESPLLQTLNPGDIAVFNADYTQMIDDLLQFTGRAYTWSLFLLDPFGSKGLQLDVVSRVVSQERADVIINLMYQDLHKKAGSAAKEQRNPIHNPHLSHWDAVYGGKAWHELAENYFHDKISKEDMERGLVELYKRILMNQDKELAVKRIPLKFQDKERTMFYLFLTTHDGTGALKMNEILDSAKISEYDHRENAKSAKKSQTNFFGDLFEDPSRPKLTEVDLGDLAKEIYDLCRGEKIAFKEILRRLADSNYYVDDVKKAMTNLKRSNKCSYGDLTNKTLVTFS